MTVDIVHDQGQLYVVDSSTNHIPCETLAVRDKSPLVTANDHMMGADGSDVGIDRQRRLVRRENSVAECVDSDRVALITASVAPRGWVRLGIRSEACT
jgi:hypothetical protein